MAFCVVPSYVIHHVFSFFDLHYQLRTLSLVCRSWHHAALCMNCINTNSTEQDARQWFARYFDTELVDLMISNFKSVIGAPYSYIVRNLVLQLLRDLQEAVPSIEIEIFMLYSQLASARQRSEKLLKVYQVSALIYLLQKLEATFNIYDIFHNVELALGEIAIPICRKDCLKMLLHVGAMINFRFDQNSPHLTDNDFHVRAAIKCFDVKLLMKKGSPWVAIFELLEATIGPKFLRPDTVFPNFEHKLVEICKNDFSDFNELLVMMESDLVPESEETPDNDSSPPNMPRTGITKFPVITDEFLSQFITLQPTDYCDRNHSPRPESPVDDEIDPTDPPDEDTEKEDDEENGGEKQHKLNTSSTRNTPSKRAPVIYNNDDNNNNYTPNKSTNNSNNNTPSSNTCTPCNPQKSKGVATTDNMEQDAANDNHATIQHLTYCDEQPPDISLSIASNPHETTINHAEKKTNNDAATSRAQKATACDIKGKRPVEDYKYFFDNEDASMDDDDESMADEESEEFEEFEDDEKENEPPTKFVKFSATTPPMQRT